MRKLSSFQKNSFNTSQIQKYKSYKQRFWRWVIMVLVGLFLISNYLSYQVLGSLQEQVTEELDTDAKGYNILQAAYSFPNVINPFIAGILIDKLGMRVGILGYTTFMVVGIIIQYISTLQSSYNLMLGGILVFGIGSEAMCIILQSFTSAWFIGKQLSLAMGIMSAAANMGTVMSNLVLPPLYEINDTITLPFLICMITQLFGYVSAFIMCGIDYAAEKNDTKRDQLIKDETNNQQQLLKENQFFIQNNSTQESSYEGNYEEQENNNQQQQQNQIKESMSCGDLKKLNNTMFLLINAIYCFEFAAILPFLNNLQNILLKFYGLGPVPAGQVLSITIIQMVVLTPLLGLITDKIGRRTEMLIGSAVFQCATFLTWMVIPTCPEGGCYWYYIPIVLSGLSGAMISCVVYPAVPLVVEPKVIGSAFGVMDCAQQVGMFIAPLIAGPIMQYGQKPSVNSYFWFYFFFLCCSVIALFFSFLIYFYDKKTGNRLNIKQNDYDEQQNQQQQN